MTTPMRAEKASVLLEIQRASTTTTIPSNEQFQLWAEAVLEGRRKEVALTIRIVDTEEGLRFNRDYRDKDYASNVLSFSAELPIGLPSELAESQLGDLLICAPVLSREAKEQGKAEADHWAHLTVHGILHLLGYDHQHEAEASQMEKLETRTLAKLGIPDPYGEF